MMSLRGDRYPSSPVSYTHLRAHETDQYLVCRLLLEKKKKYLINLALSLDSEKATICVQ